MDKLFRDMQRRMSASGFYQGAVMSAISGVEMALWDLTGQACAVPIWQLLGGRFRERIRLYNDCHAGDEDDPASCLAKALEVEGRAQGSRPGDLAAADIPTDQLRVPHSTPHIRSGPRTGVTPRRRP